VDVGARHEPGRGGHRPEAVQQALLTCSIRRCRSETSGAGPSDPDHGLVRLRCGSSPWRSAASSGATCGGRPHCDAGRPLRTAFVDGRDGLGHGARNRLGILALDQLAHLLRPERRWLRRRAVDEVAAAFLRWFLIADLMRPTEPSLSAGPGPGLLGDEDELGPAVQRPGRLVVPRAAAAAPCRRRSSGAATRGCRGATSCSRRRGPGDPRGEIVFDRARSSQWPSMRTARVPLSRCGRRSLSASAARPGAGPPCRNSK